MAAPSCRVRTAGTRAAEVAAMFDQIETVFGGVDVSSIMPVSCTGLVPLADTDDALFDRLLAIM